MIVIKKRNINEVSDLHNNANDDPAISKLKIILTFYVC